MGCVGALGCVGGSFGSGGGATPAGSVRRLCRQLVCGKLAVATKVLWRLRGAP
jgi:hypothetical protein